MFTNAFFSYVVRQVTHPKMSRLSDHFAPDNF